MSRRGGGTLTRVCLFVACVAAVVFVALHVWLDIVATTPAMSIVVSRMATAVARGTSNGAGRPPPSTWLPPSTCDIFWPSPTLCRERGVVWPVTMRLGRRDNRSRWNKTLAIFPAKGIHNTDMGPLDDNGALANVARLASADLVFADSVVEVSNGANVTDGREDKPKSWAEIRRVILEKVGVSSTDSQVVLVDVMGLNATEGEQPFTWFSTKVDLSSSSCKQPGGAWRATLCHPRSVTPEALLNAVSDAVTFDQQRAAAARSFAFPRPPHRPNATLGMPAASGRASGNNASKALFAALMSWHGRSSMWQAAVVPSSVRQSRSARALLAQSFFDFPVPSRRPRVTMPSVLHYLRYVMNYTQVRPWRLVAVVRLNEEEDRSHASPSSSSSSLSAVNSWLRQSDDPPLGGSNHSSPTPPREALHLTMTLVALANISMSVSRGVPRAKNDYNLSTARFLVPSSVFIVRQAVTDVWQLREEGHTSGASSCSYPPAMTVCLPEMQLVLVRNITQVTRRRPRTTLPSASPVGTAPPPPRAVLRLVMATPMDQALLRAQRVFFRLLTVDEGPTCQIATAGRSVSLRTFGGRNDTGDGAWTLCWPLPSVDAVLDEGAIGVGSAAIRRPLGFSFGNDDDFSFEDDLANATRNGVVMNTFDPSVAWAQAEEAAALKRGPGVIRYRRRGVSSVAFPLGVAAVSEDRRRGVAMRSRQQQTWRVRSLADAFRLADAVEERFSGATISRNVTLDPLSEELVTNGSSLPPTAAARAAPSDESVTSVIPRCTAIIKLDVEGFEWEILSSLAFDVKGPVPNASKRRHAPARTMAGSALNRLFHSHRDDAPRRVGERIVRQLNQRRCFEQLLVEVHLWPHRLPSSLLWNVTTATTSRTDGDVVAFERAVQSYLSTMYPVAELATPSPPQQGPYTADFPWGKSLTTDAAGQLRTLRAWSHILYWLRRSFSLVHVHENTRGSILRLPLPMRCCYELSFIRKP